MIREGRAGPRLTGGSFMQNVSGLKLLYGARPGINYRICRLQETAILAENITETCEKAAAERPIGFSQSGIRQGLHPGNSTGPAVSQDLGRTAPVYKRIWKPKKTTGGDGPSVLVEMP